MNTTTRRKEVVIMDLDGTLALIDERRAHAVKSNGKLDYKKFHDPDNIKMDKPNWPVIDIARMFKQANFHIFIFSGRSDQCKAETIKWLAKYQVPYSKLRMRPHKTLGFVPDEKLKRIFLEEAPFGLDQIHCVIDDRQKVVDMWRGLGLTCLQVAPGDF
jgi:hypothetical protein